jgi:hypothetical protein
MKRTLTSTLIALALVVACICIAAPAFAQNYPPTWVFARDYNYSPVIGQQANTYTFNGGSCNYTPTGGSVNGLANPIFDFSGVIVSTPVYFPVFINDATPTNSEIVTPSATSNTQTVCGFTASPANSHTTFQLQSGTAGLQEAVAYQINSAPSSVVMLDKSWYTLLTGLGSTPPSAAAVINALTGSANVEIVDTTTAPWVSYCWNGTNYTPCASNQTVPAVAAGAGAGTGPTITVVGTGVSGIVTLTTGTTPTASATIFTLTWPAIASGGFQYAPSCTISTIGTRAYTGTNASVAGPPAVDTYTATSTALTASVSGYKWSYTCR